MPRVDSRHRPTVVLADDFLADVALIESLLADDFEVVATVHDGRALVDAVARWSPDAVVTDISMPGVDGLAAAAEILRRDPAAKVVFVTAQAEPALARLAQAMGGFGYVSKLAAGDELVAAVQAALRGEWWCRCNS